MYRWVFCVCHLNLHNNECLCFLYKIEVLMVTLYPIGLILGGSQQFVLLKLNLAVRSLLSFPFKYYVGTLVK